jgi:hypothetical protein
MPRVEPDPLEDSELDEDEDERLDDELELDFDEDDEDELLLELDEDTLELEDNDEELEDEESEGVGPVTDVDVPQSVSIPIPARAMPPERIFRNSRRSSRGLVSSRDGGECLSLIGYEPPCLDVSNVRAKSSALAGVTGVAGRLPRSSVRWPG